MSGSGGTRTRTRWRFTRRCGGCGWAGPAARLGGTGGGYAWNERYRTMESSVYGSAGDPRRPDVEPAGTLGAVEAGDFGLTFEHDGLRARAVLERRKGE